MVSETEIEEVVVLQQFQDVHMAIDHQSIAERIIIQIVEKIIDIQMEVPEVMLDPEVTNKDNVQIHKDNVQIHKNVSQLWELLMISKQSFENILLIFFKKL